MELIAATQTLSNAEEKNNEKLTREIENAATELLALCDGDIKRALSYLEASYEVNWESGAGASHDMAVDHFPSP
ncbi:MAG: hypothetical protein K8T91_11050 [Planctomycetes bacterium]|nr:hypothetical protein [Planctomycetota bacterium]